MIPNPITVPLTVSENTKQIVPLTVSENTRQLNMGVGTAINISGGGGGGVSDYDDLTNRPSINNVTLTGNKSLSDLGIAAESDIPDVSGFYTKPSDGIPKSDLVSAVQTSLGKADTALQSETDPVFTASAAHGITSSDIGAWNAKSDFSGSYNDLEDKPTIPSTAAEVGAVPTSRTVNGKALSSDISLTAADVGAMDGMTILSYGHSTWADFEEAYSGKKVVYCRASSGSNPASGSQTRLAFMAYVNSAETPTEVEFQYYRSVSSHSASQQGDQVYVYKLNKTNGWSVTVREAYTKIVAGTNMGTSYNSGTLTLNFTGTIPSTAADVGAIAAPSSPATGSFLVYNGTEWVAQTLSALQGVVADDR